MSAVPAFCNTCGVTVAPESHFCESCGKPVKAAAATPAPAQVDAPAAPSAPRGNILRDTNAGPGLLSVNGRQLAFTLEQHWRGSSAPQVNNPADVVLDAAGQVVSVTPATTPLLTPQQLADLNALKDTYLPKLLARVEQIGKPLLGAVAVLAVSWIWLPAVSVHVNAVMTQNIILFDLLRLANAGASLENLGQAGGGSRGLYGLLCVLAMLAHVFLLQKWSRYGLFAPLGFMLLTAIGVYSKIHSLTSAATDSMRSFGGSQMGDLASAMMSQVMAALSVGYGLYIALAAALYLAWLGVQQVLAARN